MFTEPRQVPKSGQVDRYSSGTYFLLLIFTDWVHVCLFLLVAVCIDLSVVMLDDVPFFVQV
jgi:hypothetical protein